MWEESWQRSSIQGSPNPWFFVVLGVMEWLGDLEVSVKKCPGGRVACMMFLMHWILFGESSGFELLLDEILGLHVGPYTGCWVGEGLGIFLFESV